jgi:hypothetical protein
MDVIFSDCIYYSETILEQPVCLLGYNLDKKMRCTTDGTICGDYNL